MEKFMIGLMLLISPLFSLGHNPLSARYHLEAGEHASLLTIHLSQEGVNQALLQQYSQQELEELTRQQLEELMVDYLKSHFLLSVDNKEIMLGQGGIKQGNHQTDAKFVLPPFSSKTERLDIPAFQENGTHQTIFSYNLNGRADYLILDAQNAYQAGIKFSGPVQINWGIWVMLLGSISLILLILLKWSISPKRPKLSMVKP